MDRMGSQISGKEIRWTVSRENCEEIKQNYKFCKTKSCKARP